MSDKLRAFTMPKWGIEMAEGTMGEWLVAEGDTFVKGDTLCAIETDKIANEVDADHDSTLLKIILEEGDVASVGALIAVLGPVDTPAAEIAKFIDEYVAADTSFEPDDDDTLTPETAKSSQEVASKEKADEPIPEEKPEFIIDDSIVISPVAKKMAYDASIDVSSITGSGAGGRILAQDIHRHQNPSLETPKRDPVDNQASVDNDAINITATASQLARQYEVNLDEVSGTGRHGRITRSDVLEIAKPTAAVRVQKFDAMRRTMAKRLVLAKQTIPHFYLHTEVEMDWLLQVREKINMQSTQKVSLNDFIIKATAKALMEIEGVNVHVFDNEIHHFPSANIAVAVSVDGGILTPVVAAAETKSVTAISTEMKTLGESARKGTLLPEQYSDGTFTISNLGMFGINSFEAVINPPQGAILAVGSINRLPREENYALTFKNIMQLTLSCDHRAIDGALGAKFLEKLKAQLEQPATLIENM